MNIDHVHFYVENAQHWQTWFTQKFGFSVLANGFNEHTLTIIVGTPTIQFWLSSPLSSASPVATYLRQHPAGVADLAFQVRDLEAVVHRAIQAGAILLQPIQVVGEARKTACIQGWGSLRHTLVQAPSEISLLPIALNWVGIDHAVLNVATGDLDRAIIWYENALGLQRQQSFAIQTEHSALCSQVLTHPDGAVKFPINQPASMGSQIQEFLDCNRGTGIQHIALRTSAMAATMMHLREQGVQFLPIPHCYYKRLKQRPGFRLNQTEWTTIAEHEILVDWQPQMPEALLLQAFTQPIFEQPTFFFELIERRSYWVNQGLVNQGLAVAEGFGEGNFRALFEAIEREQMKRGSLKVISQEVSL